MNGSSYLEVAVVSDPEFCPIAEVFHLFSGKWTTRALFKLSTGIKRPGELRRHLPGISKKVLTQTLRNLEQAGLVSRTVYPVVPPKVEYVLTSDGKALVEPVVALVEWSLSNKQRLRRIHSKTNQP